jgi:outer membrane protein assembly factor BamE (lipoprotein component of BamABCDE complex)
VVSRDILVLYFNKKKRLKNLDRFNKNDGKYVDINMESTTLRDEEKSLLAAIFSNVGISGVRAPD